MGSVAEGKNADLVLLDANPIANVANLHRISAVVRAGTYYPSDALDAMKEQTATRVAAGLASAPHVLPLCACCMA
jgi:cytosine/adenosine deaminase-related metal-dependent hydrolase